MIHGFRRWSVALCGLLIGLARPAGAQDPTQPPQEFSRIDHLFGQLNVSSERLPTGLLLDYGLHLANLSHYDPTVEAPADTVLPADLTAWRTAYATLMTAQVGARMRLPLLRDINTRLREAQPHGAANAALDGAPVPLMLLFAEYEHLREDALEKKLLTLTPDSQLVDAGAALTPYARATAFVAAPGRETVRGPVVRFQYDPEQFFIKASDRPLGQALDVDFGDGIGWRTLAPKTVVEVKYDKSGLYGLRFRLRDNATGQWQHARGRLNVVVPDPADVAARAALYAATRSYHFGTLTQTGLAAAPTDYGVPAGATVTVTYGGGRDITTLVAPGQMPRFRKPLIVVEGFDPWEFVPNGENTDFADFMRKIQNVLYTGATSFASQLDYTGQYDLIHVDFDKGTDDIRRNAMRVVEIIEWVKLNRDPAFPIDPANPQDPNRPVVLGQSMGGLVGRFALSWMDRHNRAPGVRLLITHDAPHRGASVPLALQIGVRRLASMNLWWAAALHPVGIVGVFLTPADLSQDVENIKNLLREPATRQLMIAQDIEDNDFLENEYRNTITYAAPSYRFVAIANGSECGTPQALAPYGELLRMEAHFYANPIGILAGTSVLGAVLPIAAVLIRPIPAVGSLGLGAAAAMAIRGALLSVCGRQFTTQCVLNAQPDNANGSERIYFVRIAYQMHLSFLMGFVRIRLPIRIPLYQGDENARAGLLSYETAPGGGYTLRDVELSKNTSTPNWLYPFVDAGLRFEGATNFGFVPTVSAIDYPGPLTRAAVFNGYSGTAAPGTASRAAAFVTQEPRASFTNSDHISFNQRNARWTYEQLDQQATLTPGCATLTCNADNLTISGPRNICRTGNTFSVPAVAGATYTWTWGSGIRPVAGANLNSPSITFEPVGTGTDRTTIRVQIRSECTSTVSRELIVSARETPAIPSGWINSQAGNECNPLFSLSLPPVIGAVSYSWELTPSNNLAYTLYGSSRTATSSANPPNWQIRIAHSGDAIGFEVDVTAYSNCGTTPTTSTIYVTFARPGTGASGQPCPFNRPAVSSSPFGLYPIPANATLHVELLDTDSTATGSWNDDLALTTHLQIVDYYGQTWLSQTMPGRVGDLNIAAVPPGIYVLRVQRGARLETTPITIER